MFKRNVKEMEELLYKDEIVHIRKVSRIRKVVTVMGLHSPPP